MLFLVQVGPRLSQLNPDLSQLNPNLSQLNPDLSQLNPNLTQLNPNLSQLNPNLSQLNPNLSRLNPDLSQLNPDLSQLNPNVAQLNPDLSACQPDHDACVEVGAGSQGSYRPSSPSQLIYRYLIPNMKLAIELNQPELTHQPESKPTVRSAALTNPNCTKASRDKYDELSAKVDGLTAGWVTVAPEKHSQQISPIEHSSSKLLDR